MLIKVNKKLMPFLLSFTIMLSVFAISINVAKASTPSPTEPRRARIAEVIESWDHLRYYDERCFTMYERDENVNYITITFINRYTYTEYHKDTTSIDDLIGRRERTHYWRVYKFY